MEEVALDINFKTTSICLLAGKRACPANRSNANKGRGKNKHGSQSKLQKTLMIKKNPITCIFIICGMQISVTNTLLGIIIYGNGEGLVISSLKILLPY